MKDFLKFEDSKEFAFVYKTGKKWYCDGFIIFYLENTEKKMAVVASKKVGKAVKRNRAKRILRALFFRFKDKVKNGKYIFVAKNELTEISFFDLEKNLKRGFKKLECLREFA